VLAKGLLGADGPSQNDPGLRHRGRNYLAVICFFCEALMKQVLFAAPGFKRRLH
jgi:hypothetical protein